MVLANPNLDHQSWLTSFSPLKLSHLCCRLHRRQGHPDDIHNEGGFNINSLFKNQVFYTLIVSVMSTYGLWLIASIIMFDPWHMFTSLIQYMLMTPSFTNVLNVYAFCNTHDVSWGTKGDDKPEKLGSVSTKDGQLKTDLPDEGDLNQMYEKELAVFRTKFVAEKKPPTPSSSARSRWTTTAVSGPSSCWSG